MPCSFSHRRTALWCAATSALFTATAKAQTPDDAQIEVTVIQCEPVTQWVLDSFRARTRRAERRYQRRLKRRPDEEHVLESPRPPPMVPEREWDMPFINAEVTLMGSAERSCSTDTQGLCTFSGLPAGTYDVTAEVTDLIPNAMRGISLAESESKSITLCVIPGANDGMEIMVTSLPARTAL